MKTRVITAVIALLIFVPLLLLGHIWFGTLVVAMGLVGTAEILRMRKKILVSPEAYLAFAMTVLLIVPLNYMKYLPGTENALNYLYLLVCVTLAYTVFSKNRFSFEDAGVLILGSLYVGMGFHYLIIARHEGVAMAFLPLVIVWLTDTGAYLFGRKFGKHKLAVHISPNKTWEGAIGGTLLATVVASGYLALFPVHADVTYNFPTMVLIIFALSIVGQLGDLIESALKRYYGVKDSGKIMPGHGGILDRFDSLLLVLPAMHFIGLL